MHEKAVVSSWCIYDFKDFLNFVHFIFFRFSSLVDRVAAKFNNNASCNSIMNAVMDNVGVSGSKFKDFENLNS